MSPGRSGAHPPATRPQAARHAGGLGTGPEPTIPFPMEITSMLARERRPMPAFVDPAPGILDHLDALQASADPHSPEWRAEALRRAQARRANAQGPTAWRLADDAVAQARRGLPPPAALPSLSDALARRATVFGPYDGDELDDLPDVPRGPAQALGALARRVVAALDIRRRTS